MKKQISILFGFVLILLPLIMFMPANTASGQDKTDLSENLETLDLDDSHTREKNSTEDGHGEKETLKKRTAEEETSKEDTVVEAAVETDTETVPSTYLVKKGDSLWKIAGEQLHDSLKWTELYENNRDLLGTDPNLIYPGQELIISGI